MTTAIAVTLVVLGVGTGFFAGYKTRERKIVRELRSAAKSQYVETAQDLADFINPDKPS